MSVNDYFIAIVQGIVQGLTEFIPVSSTGHLILTGRLLGHTGEAAKSFDVFIQLGSILAVAWVYRERLRGLARDWRRTLRPASRGLTAWHFAAAMAPAVFLGLGLHRFIKQHLFSPETVLVGLVVGGAYMIAAEHSGVRTSVEQAEGITLRQAFAVGLFQCLALWPGFSRSGSTIAGGLFLGLGRQAATDFSFLLAIPMMVAATGLDLVRSLDDLSAADVGPFAVGFVTAFAVAWLAVVWFLRLVARVRLTPFALYRFAVAALFAWVLWAKS